MNLQLFLLLAAGLFAIGLYGALSQQAIVMIMMGLELMLNGVIVAAAAFWHYAAPASSTQVIVVVAVVAMARTAPAPSGTAGSSQASHGGPVIASARRPRR